MVPKTGSNVKFEPFEHLIQHIKQTDPMLFEALKRTSRYFSVVQNDVIKAAPVAVIPQVYWRTLLIKDTTVGNDISDAEIVHASGTGIKIAWVLHKAIASNLVVVIKKNTVTIATITILSSSTLNYEYKVSLTSIKFILGEILTFNITGSDGSKNVVGVAALTITWA